MSFDEVKDRLSRSLPPYFVAAYQKLLYVIDIKLAPQVLDPAARFKKVFQEHQSKRSEAEALAYAHAILAGLGWEELDDLEVFVDKTVQIDDSLTEELKRFEKFEHVVYSTLRPFGVQFDGYQISRYLLAVKVVLKNFSLDTEDFVECFLPLENKLGSCSRAVAFTIAVLERSSWGRTRTLKQFASPDFDLNTEYPKVDLCLTVADYYGSMSEKEFSSAKLITSIVHLDRRNVNRYNPVNFTILLLQQNIITVGDVSNIEDKSKSSIFIQDYKERCRGILASSSHKTVMKTKPASLTASIKERHTKMKDDFNFLLMFAASEALKKKSLDEVKSCLKNKVKNEVEAILDAVSLAKFLQRYCFLSNFSLLKYMTDDLNLKESKSTIEKLAKERDAFNSEVLAKDFATEGIIDHKIKNNYHVEMVVVTSWSPSEVTLARFQKCITEEFKDEDLSMFVALRAVHQSWLTFICTIPFLCVDAIRRVANEIRLAGIESIAINHEALPSFYGREIRTQQQVPDAAIIPPPIPPPELFPKKGDKSYEKDLPNDATKDIVKDIKILLMTATENELRGVLGYLKPLDSAKKIIEAFVNKSTWIYIGKYGKHSVVVGRSAYGKSQQGGLDAYAVTKKIMETDLFEPKYIIAVGVCYGMNQSQVQLGDVIVSDMIIDLSTYRKEPASIAARRAQPPAGVTLLSLFGNTSEFKMKHSDKENAEMVEVHCGPIVSSSVLVDDAEFKKQLKEVRPGALGGEMEGTGIFRAASDVHHKVDAIVIKAVGDWADGKKDECKGWKDFASHAAATYVHYHLDNVPADALN